MFHLGGQNVFYNVSNPLFSLLIRYSYVLVFPLAIHMFVHLLP